MKRAGLRALHPSAYSFASATAKRRSRLEAAFLAPQMFPGGDLRAHVFPMRPHGRRGWEVLIGVDFPVKVGSGVQREFWAELDSNSSVVASFDRTFTIRAKVDAANGKVVRATFLEPAFVPAGTYTLSIIVRDPTADAPWSTTARVEIPEISSGRSPFVVGPILGKRRGDDLVVYGAKVLKRRPSDPAADRVGGAQSFRPVFVQEADRREPVAALSQVCVKRSKRSPEQATVGRRLLFADGRAAAEVPEAAFAPKGDDVFACEGYVDVVPVERLPSGPYRFEVAIREQEKGVLATAELGFDVVEP